MGADALPTGRDRGTPRRAGGHRRRRGGSEGRRAPGSLRSARPAPDGVQVVEPEVVVARRCQRLIGDPQPGDGEEGQDQRRPRAREPFARSVRGRRRGRQPRARSAARTRTRRSSGRGSRPGDRRGAQRARSTGRLPQALRRASRRRAARPLAGRRGRRPASTPPANSQIPITASEQHGIHGNSEDRMAGTPDLTRDPWTIATSRAGGRGVGFRGVPAGRPEEPRARRRTRAACA